MIGCVGRIGYIYLPDPAYRASYNYLGSKCSAPVESRPFEADSLPDVNSIVAISNSGASLLSHEEIASHLGSFQSISFMKAADGDECHANLSDHADVKGNPMYPGRRGQQRAGAASDAEWQ
jgi:hypothetical protein